MKTKKLLEKLGGFLNADKSAQAREIDSIRKVLKKLKEKERKLRRKLEDQPEREDRDEIAERLQIIYAQRRKGVVRVRALLNRDGDDRIQ